MNSINAELNHNPYLQLTAVRFNGQAPRVNSQIEKYEKLPLKDWVYLIPEIFYQEMNGYDFDLYFIGTPTDFEEIRHAFSDAGVTESDVRLIFKNEVEDPDTKSREIDDLLTWLEEHPNDRFDFHAFREENADLLEGTFPYLVIRGNISQKIGESVSMEHVDSAAELNSAVLINTPILFYVDSKNESAFREDLKTLLSRNDVQENQLFFILHPSVNAERMTRVIIDLGVKAPQVIPKPDDALVISYIRNYPMTEYIRNVIRIMEAAKLKISESLAEGNRKNQISNAGIHAQIEHHEAELSELRRINTLFIDRDRFSMPQEINDIRNHYEKQIMEWKNRKIKVTGDEEAAAAAAEYQQYLRKCTDEYLTAVQTCVTKAKEKMRSVLTLQYLSAGIDATFRPDEADFPTAPQNQFPEIIPELLLLKEISYETKSSIFSVLRKQNPDASHEAVQVTTYNFDQWRNKAREILIPFAEQVLPYWAEALETCYHALAEAYHKHTDELIVQITAAKEKVSQQLSDEERLLQEDNDWLSLFSEKLTRIERG